MGYPFSAQDFPGLLPSWLKTCAHLAAPPFLFNSLSIEEKSHPPEHLSSVNNLHQITTRLQAFRNPYNVKHRLSLSSLPDPVIPTRTTHSLHSNRLTSKIIHVKRRRSRVPLGIHMLFPGPKMSNTRYNVQSLVGSSLVAPSERLHFTRTEGRSY